MVEIQLGIKSIELRDHNGSTPGWASTRLGCGGQVLKISQKHRCRNYYSAEAETDSQGESKSQGKVKA